MSHDRTIKVHIKTHRYNLHIYKCDNKRTHFCTRQTIL